MIDIKQMYDTEPFLYDKFANDRDFLAQSREILNTLINPPGKVIELMAGPARHIKSFMELGHVDIYAIDSSTSMRDFAVEEVGIPSKKYVNSVLPEALEKFDDCTIDCILLLRFGIGYLDHTQLDTTIRESARALRSGGKLFLECHRWDYLASNFKELAIRERSLEKTSGSGTVKWPDGDLFWDRHGGFVEMKVNVSTVNGSKLYHSKEYIVLSNKNHTCYNM